MLFQPLPAYYAKSICSILCVSLASLTSRSLGLWSSHLRAPCGQEYTGRKVETGDSVGLSISTAFLANVVAMSCPLPPTYYISNIDILASCDIYLGIVWKCEKSGGKHTLTSCMHNLRVCMEM